MVEQGSVPEPSWRPYPGSDLDRAETDDEIATARDARRARGRLPQSVRAHHWKRYTQSAALLVAGEGATTSFVGAANVGGGRRSSLPGVRNLEIGPWGVTEPVSVRSVLDTMPDRPRQHLERILNDGVTRLLPPVTEAALVAALASSASELLQALRSLPPLVFARRRPTENLAQLDANQTALRLFTAGWHSLQPVDEPEDPPSLALELELTVRGSENDYIMDDATKFLDWDSTGRTVQGWFEFREGYRRLHVKNINVSPAETITGADLVYVSRDPDTIVLVQYKLLETYQKSGDDYFRDDGRLLKQVNKMIDLAGSSVERGADENECRVGPDFGFVKFIKPANRATMRVDEMPEGRYHPVDAVRRMMGNPDLGPNQGQVFYVARRRSIDGQTFATLVRDRWVGSTQNATTVLLSVLGVAPSSGQVTLAVDETSPSPADHDESGEFPTAEDLGLGGNQSAWRSSSEKSPF